MSDLIADAIREHWGERCPDFDPECWCCRAWVEYDGVERLRAALRPCGEAVMPDITIPPEAVEAAARAVYETWCKVHGVEDTSMPWGDIDDEERDACFAEAIAALRAGIAAWPGMWHIRAVDFEGKVILPLPQEARDE